MRRKKITSLATAFDDWVEKNPIIEEGLRARRAEEILRDRLGMLNKYVSSIEYRDGILYLSLHSSAMRAKLQVAKGVLLGYINERLGLDFLKDLRFR